MGIGPVRLMGMGRGRPSPVVGVNRKCVGWTFKYSATLLATYSLTKSHDNKYLLILHILGENTLKVLSDHLI